MSRTLGSKNKDKAMLEQDIQDAFFNIRYRKDLLAKLWKKAFDMALGRGDYFPIKTMWEQGFGRPRERVEVTTPGDGLICLMSRTRKEIPSVTQEVPEVTEAKEVPLLPEN